jgi:hypothetical protein
MDTLRMLLMEADHKQTLGDQNFSVDSKEKEDQLLKDHPESFEPGAQYGMGAYEPRVLIKGTALQHLVDKHHAKHAGAKFYKELLKHFSQLSFWPRSEKTGNIVQHKEKDLYRWRFHSTKYEEGQWMVNTPFYQEIIKDVIDTLKSLDAYGMGEKIDNDNVRWTASRVLENVGHPHGSPYNSINIAYKRALKHVRKIKTKAADSNEIEAANASYKRQAAGRKLAKHQEIHDEYLKAIDLIRMKMKANKKHITKYKKEAGL